MKLTQAQQATVSDLLPMALRLARAMSQDDEYESVATLSLCNAVLRYREGCGVSVKTHAWRTVRRDILDAIARDRRAMTNCDFSAVPAAESPEDYLAALPPTVREVMRMWLVENADLRRIEKVVGIRRDLVQHYIDRGCVLLRTEHQCAAS